MEMNLKPQGEAEGAGSAAWRDMLVTAAHPDHIVQFYENLDFLAEAVVLFVADAIMKEEAIVLVATAPHWERFHSQLALSGIASDQLAKAGQLTVLDADDALSRFMVNGAPDPEKFQELIGGVIRTARAGGRYSTVRVYGEMVNVLWQEGKRAAALRLEGLWNDLLKQTPFSLFCAYRLDVFDASLDKDLLRGVCQGHSHVIPAPDYDRFDKAVWNAIDGILGDRQSAMLRTVAGSGASSRTEMPESQSALLWLRDNMPRTAVKVLAQGRQRYDAQ
jgi:hypothetical protein